MLSIRFKKKKPPKKPTTRACRWLATHYYTLKPCLSLFLIVLIGVLFRFTNHQWDQGQHLHPDERFLNMFIYDAKTPKSIAEYLDPTVSPLNPRNNNHDFFVYGNFPVHLSKWFSIATHSQSFYQVALGGRALSAAADSATIVAVFLLTMLIEKSFNHQIKQNTSKNAGQLITISPSTKYWSALVYALMVVPIQQSHFFTTDSFLVCFIAYSLVGVMTFYRAHQLHVFKSFALLSLVFGGLFFGLALGSKINALMVLPLILALIGWRLFFGDLSKQASARKFLENFKQKWWQMLALSMLFLLFAYVSTRLGSPYLFANNNWLDPRPDPSFLADLRELNQWSRPDVWFPPAVQWINRPFWFGLVNLSMVGMGIPITTFCVIGLILSIKSGLKIFVSKSRLLDRTLVLLFSGWSMALLGFYCLQFNNSIRYQYLAYPVFALLAGWGITTVLSIWENHRFFVNALILVFIFFWPASFINIYLQPHSRIKASYWLNNHVPANTIILNEHWDDALPLDLGPNTPRFQLIQLPVFREDTPDKWKEMNAFFAQSEYYVLSSNRAWGSISRVPEKYPQMAQFYQQLFSNKTPYKLQTVITSYPGFEYLGLPIVFPDYWAEETFSVYDHPEVYIFKR